MISPPDDQIILKVYLNPDFMQMSLFISQVVQKEVVGGDDYRLWASSPHKNHWLSFYCISDIQPHGCKQLQSPNPQSEISNDGYTPVSHPL